MQDEQHPDMLLFRPPPAPASQNGRSSRAIVSGCTMPGQKLEFVWSLTGASALEEPDDTAVLAFGFPGDSDAPKTACVQLRACRGDEPNAPYVALEWVGYDACCCVGCGMRRGVDGTVPMVQGALALACRLAPFRGLSEVTFMDTSRRSPVRGRLSCSDVHILRDPEHLTWYERHFGARVCPEKASALAALRGALAERIMCSEREFMRALRLGVMGLDLMEWFASVSERVRGAFAAAKESRASWGELLRELVIALWPRDGDEGDDPECPNVMCALAAALGNGVVCPRWITTNGWCWSILLQTIRAYPIEVSCD